MGFPPLDKLEYGYQTKWREIWECVYQCIEVQQRAHATELDRIRARVSLPRTSDAINDWINVVIAPAVTQFNCDFVPWHRFHTKWSTSLSRYYHSFFIHFDLQASSTAFWTHHLLCHLLLFAQSKWKVNEWDGGHSRLSRVMGSFQCKVSIQFHLYNILIYSF